MREVATRSIPGIIHLIIASILNSLSFFSLRRRRHRGDLKETSNILRGFLSVDSTELFSLRESRGLTDQHFMLAKPRVSPNFLRCIFTVSAVNNWKKLQSEVFLDPYIHCYKLLLDSAWIASNSLIFIILTLSLFHCFYYFFQNMYSC